MFELLSGRGIGNCPSSYAFIYLFNTFTILGTNPPSDAGPLYYIWSAFLNTFCIIFSPFLCTVGFIMKYMQSTITTMQFLSGIQAGTNVLGIPPKCLTLAFSLKRMRSIEPLLDVMDARYTDPEDVALIRQAAIMGNRLVFGFGMTYLTYMLLTITPPLISGNVPLSIWIPFLDENQSRLHHLMQVVMDLFLMFFLLFHQVVNDSYGTVYIYVIRTHLRLLIRRVERLCVNGEKSVEDNMAELVDCVTTHQQILSLLTIIEPIISVTMFTQFLIIAIILCVTMVNMFIFADLSTQIASTFYFMCVLMQTSPCCYFATELKADSERLPLAIFHCRWMDQDQRFRKVIIYFMHRAQSPIELMAMKLFPINVATNISLAKFSFTLFTFIKEMGVGQDARE